MFSLAARAAGLAAWRGMSQPSGSPAVPNETPPVCSGPLLRWEILFLIALVTGLLAAFLLKSKVTYLGHDDFCTTTLLSNPHFGEMLETIGNGGEVNPPLLFVLGWGVARVFGTGELPMRALSAFPLMLAAVVTFFALRRAVGSRPAALSTVLVFGLSHSVFDFMYSARYYGLFTLVAALAAFLFVKISGGKKLERSDLLFVFLVHTALVWLHLFGWFFSGMWFAGLLLMDWLRGRRRWSLYAAVIVAWATFVLWLPALQRQLQVTRDGTWTPRMPFAEFVEEPAMQTPLTRVFLLLAILGLAVFVTKRGGEAGEKISSKGKLLPLLVLGLAWMAVPFGTWAASQVIKPFYMQRYVAPCVIALSCLVGVVVWWIERLPRAARARLPAWLEKMTWTGITVFCLVFQSLRALRDGPRPARAFNDLDFGHPQLPMVFEDSMGYLIRAYYGRGREYAMIIDRDAAEADPGYFTKLEERYFSKFRPHYADKLRILSFNELPEWPEGFLAVKTSPAKTWEWIFAHHPELKVKLIGNWPGGQRVYLVRRSKP